ncbi:hypothetical protein BDC45DRAFT_183135 [Circinella umbellata]|nr:hypothetical protein BDC45DRAFT_183135 [Circinella umbellata]
MIFFSFFLWAHISILFLLLKNTPAQINTTQIKLKNDQKEKKIPFHPPPPFHSSTHVLYIYLHLSFFTQKAHIFVLTVYIFYFMTSGC